MFHKIVGVLLILAGIGYALLMLMAAGMPDSPSATAEAMGELWTALIPIGLGVLAFFWRWG